MSESRLTLYTPSNMIAMTILIASTIWLAWWFFDRSRYVYVTDARISANMINVSSRIPGWVTEFDLSEGQEVTQGQLLAKIDARDANLQLAEVDASIDRLRNEVERSELELALAEKQVSSAIAAAESNLAAVRAELSEANVERTRAEKDFNRSKSLLKQNMISEETFELKQAAFEKAAETFRRNQAEVAVAEAQLLTAQADLSRVDVVRKSIEIANARIREQQIEETRLNNLLADHGIISPSHGVVDETFINQGEHVYPGQRILMLHDPGRIWVKANVKETDVRHLAIGNKVEISVDAFPDQRFYGQIAGIGTAATSQFAMLPSPNPSGNFTKITQRFEVKVEVTDPIPALKPGMMVELRIPIDT